MFSFCLPFFSPFPSPVLPVSLSHSSFYYPSLSFSPDLLSFTIPLFPFLSYPCSHSLYLAVRRSPLAPSYQSYFLLSSNHIYSHLCLFDFPNHYHRSPPNHRNTKSTNLITNRNLYLHLYSLHLNTYSFHDSAPLSISTIITFTFISFPLSHGFKPFYTGLQKPPLSLITKSKSRRFCSTFPTDLHKIRSQKNKRSPSTGQFLSLGTHHLSKLASILPVFANSQGSPGTSQSLSNSIQDSKREGIPAFANTHKQK